MKKIVVSLLLLFIGTWFLKLWYGGQLDFYILPRFNILVVSSGILLCISGLMLLFLKASWHHTRYHLEARSFFSFFVLIVLAFFIPPQPLSSQSVAQRGVETDLSQIRLTTPINFSIDSNKRTFADWINIIGTSENVRPFVDESARIKGFVYRDEDLEANEFYLARFLIRCCSADARPVVIRVKTENANQFQNDQWLEMTGVFALDDDREELFIILDSSVEIPVPETPYIY